MIKLYWTNNMPMGCEAEKIEGSLIGIFKDRAGSVRAANVWLETHGIRRDKYSRSCVDARGREWEDYGSWSHFFVREEIEENSGEFI